MQIDERDLDILARETIEATRRYFALPGVKEKYEAWLAKRKEKEEKTRYYEKTSDTQLF